MARFSSRTGTWSGRRSRVNVPLPETVRDERQWQTQLPGGLIRTDFGAPIPRHPTEPQPVHVGGSIKRPEIAAEPVPVLIALPPSVPSADAAARLRDHRSITREP
jgi:hypothetical protein